jgi:uncharacterized protein (DUF362 family)
MAAPLPFRMSLDSNTVYLVREEGASYAAGAAGRLLARALADAGASLSELIGGAALVVVKPNWVYHENRGGEGLDCMVTHSSLVEAIVSEVAKCRHARIVVGDAPVQGCDFGALWRACDLSRLAARFDGRVAIRDFRLKTRDGASFASRHNESGRPREAYIEFDLGRESRLEPVTNGAGFRVTMYDPDALAAAHAPGVHRYLVAREVIEADVVINVSKLKTHRKAGLTGALKNAVGINGLKDYLPHHRKGGTAQGGDCYPGAGRLKAAAEVFLDAGNRSNRRWMTALCGGAAAVSAKLDRLAGGDGDVEGSWYGNDTVWRMVLDLNRILRYGRLDGTLSSEPARRTLAITDAIVAGDGEGPLFPSPVPLGALTLAADAAAADWVHALMMGFDPEKIPLVRNAVKDPREIRIVLNGTKAPAAELPPRGWPRFRPPSGWRHHCELEQVDAC